MPAINDTAAANAEDLDRAHAKLMSVVVGLDAKSVDLRGEKFILEDIADCLWTLSEREEARAKGSANNGSPISVPELAAAAASLKHCAGELKAAADQPSDLGVVGRVAAFLEMVGDSYAARVARLNGSADPDCRKADAIRSAAYARAKVDVDEAGRALKSGDRAGATELLREADRRMDAADFARAKASMEEARRGVDAAKTEAGVALAADAYRALFNAFLEVPARDAKELEEKWNILVREVDEGAPYEEAWIDAIREDSLRLARR